MSAFRACTASDLRRKAGYEIAAIEREPIMAQWFRNVFLGLLGSMNARSRSTEPAADRRSTQRERCVLRCRITHGPWDEVVDAVIRDLHEDGARLRLNSRSVVTSRLRMKIQQTGLDYIGTVIWQRGDELGVRLVETLDQTVERQIEALLLAGAKMRQSTIPHAEDDRY